GVAVLNATTRVTVKVGSDTAVATHTNRTVKTGATGQAANFENVTGGAGNDSLTGNAAANSLAGSGGNDSLAGAAGNDTLDGGPGSDTMTAGTGDDIYQVFAASSGGGDTVGGVGGEGARRGAVSRLDMGPAGERE